MYIPNRCFSVDFSWFLFLYVQTKKYLNDGIYNNCRSKRIWRIIEVAYIPRDRSSFPYRTPGTYNRRKKIKAIRDIFDENNESKGIDHALDLTLNFYKIKDDLSPEIVGRLLGEPRGKAARSYGYEFLGNHAEKELEDYYQEEEND